MHIDKERFLDIISSAFTANNLKAIEHALDACNQSPETGQVDAIVMLQKTLKDEFERVDEVAKSVKGEVDEQFYRGIRSGLKKALDAAERFIERAK